MNHLACNANRRSRELHPAATKGRLAPRDPQLDAKAPRRVPRRARTPSRCWCALARHPRRSQAVRRRRRSRSRRTWRRRRGPSSTARSSSSRRRSRRSRKTATRFPARRRALDDDDELWPLGFRLSRVGDPVRGCVDDLSGCRTRSRATTVAAAAGTGWAPRSERAIAGRSRRRLPRARHTSGRRNASLRVTRDANVVPRRWASAASDSMPGQTARAVVSPRSTSYVVRLVHAERVEARSEQRAALASARADAAR